MPPARTLLLLCFAFPLAIGPGAGGVSMLAPASGTASDDANRLKCANHLRQIGQASLLYTCDNRIYPTHLGLLVKHADVHPSILTSPMRGTVVPPAILGATP